MKYDVVVIGAGISGISAAIYLKRANKKVLLIEKNIIGGVINKTSSIRNYPGIIDINGADLSSILYKQIKENNIEVLYNTVLDIKNDKSFKVVILNDQEIKTKYVIIATGKENRKLNVPLEKELTGKGISYCAICDGMFFKGKNVCVVGTGSAAVEESLFLSKICKNVTLIAKYNQLKCQEILLNEVNKTKNITILYESSVERFNEKDGLLSSIVYKKENKLNELKVDGCFIYIGSTPNIFAKIDFDTNKNYLVVNDKMETNIKGIYAVGDVIKKDLYQLVTASSEGAIAATSIIKELNTK